MYAIRSYYVPQTIETCHSASTIFGAVKKLDLENNDLIIVSSQTGIFSDSLEVGTGRGGGLISISVLFGSKPDFSILASDTTDLEFIKKNVITSYSIHYTKLYDPVYVQLCASGYLRLRRWWPIPHLYRSAIDNPWPILESPQTVCGDDADWSDPHSHHR